MEVLKKSPEELVKSWEERHQAFMARDHEIHRPFYQRIATVLSEYNRRQTPLGKAAKKIFHILVFKP